MIIVLSVPKANTEEALRRVFNALATAYKFRQSGDEVGVLFQGTGTRWVKLLSKPYHPVHGLFNLMKDKVLGVYSGCADVFGAREGVTSCDASVVAGNAVLGTSGLPSLAVGSRVGTKS